MARSLRVREQHIALFGESGSGKTVLVSSFFGPTMERSYSNDLWDLVADDTSQGNRLYQNYLGMRDRASTPAATRFASTTYRFTLRSKVNQAASPTRQSFDAVRLVWHDYPGEWFEESPSSEEEEGRRVETFRSLLASDVALFLVDAQKLLEYQGEEERYLRSLLTNFRQGILRLRDDLLVDGERLVEFPRIWVFALSKADLVPEWDTHTFRDLLIGSVAEPIASLRSTLQEFVDTPDALSVGEDYMLLSSAKFEVSSLEDAPTRIDVSKRVGIDLILPIASILPIERRVLWSERMAVPRKVLDSMGDGTERAVGAVGGWLLSRLPHVGPIARIAAQAALNDLAKLAGDRLKEANATARANDDFLRATLSQFKIDLENGVSGGFIVRRQK